MQQLGEMKKITIALDEEVAQWARIRAAEQETSVSQLIGHMLEQEMLHEKTYGTAMRQYYSRPGRVLRQTEIAYPSRSELHDR